MNTKVTNTFNARKSLLTIVLGTAVILAIPLIATQFTDEVDWSPVDFVVIGTLLMGVGLIFVALAQNIKSGLHRTILGIGLGLVVLLIWAELAVGIVGTPFAGS